ncbi:MAG TPA: hypothetical protein VF176_03880 [Solirubrobacterales bacterium]
MVDDGEAIHYAAVRPGTPVYSSDAEEVGRVLRVLDNQREHIFDGIIFEDVDGTVRFADAPEVARTAERGVTLSIDAGAARELPPPEKSAPAFRPNRAGRLGRFFGGGWKRH